MKNISPLVSVCVIAFNHARYIDKCLESILNQTISSQIEVLIHDDASSDKTAKKIKSWAERYPDQIFPIIQEENQFSRGININPWFNFSRAKGSYIAVCEGDDFWVDTKKLEQQIAALQRTQHAMICFHPAIFHSEDNKHYCDKAGWHGHNEKIFSSYEVSKLGGAMMPTASLLIKHEVIESIVSFFERNRLPAGDVFIQYLASNSGGALYIPNVMSAYRILHEGSLSQKQQKPRKQIEIIDDLMKYNKSISDPIWRNYEKRGVVTLHANLKCESISQAVKNGYYYLALRTIFSLPISDFHTLIRYIYGIIIKRLKG